MDSIYIDTSAGKRFLFIGGNDGCDGGIACFIVYVYLFDVCCNCT
jgi:hypothetical protein